MSAFTPVNCIVSSVDIGGGKAIVELKAPRSTLTLELAQDSGWLETLTEGAVVQYTMEITQRGAPILGGFTIKHEIQERPLVPGAPVAMEPGVDGQPPTATFATPASDIPPSEFSAETPATPDTNGVMANAPIADVKAALGL